MVFAQVSATVHVTKAGSIGSELGLIDPYIWLTYYHSLPLRVRSSMSTCHAPPHVVVSEER